MVVRKSNEPIRWVICQICCRRLKGYVPKGGDGSLACAPRHTWPSGKRCEGSNWEASWA